MEIGFSQNVLIDIGLNAAGFFLGGMIIMLIGSFRKSHRAAVAVSAGAAAVVQPSVEPLSKARPHRGSKSDFNGEYINLNNFDWQGQTASIPKRESSPTARNRQEVIRMARQMVADKRNDGDVKANLPITDGELAYARYLEKLTSTGRN